MENKAKIDETSKDDAELNVNPVLPDTGNPTSPEQKPTEPSGDSEKNTQEAVQKHAELRKKAEEEKAKAEQDAADANKRAEDSTREANRLKKEKVENMIASAIKDSKLPEGYRNNRIGKDPMKWFFAHAENVPKEISWDDAEKLVTEQLSGLVSGLESDLHVGGKKEEVPADPSKTFTDTDNSPAPGQQPTKGNITVESLAKMSPYEINALPDEIKTQLAQAGNKIDL